MKTSTKIFHILATSFSSLVIFHAFIMSVACQTHTLYTVAFGLSLWYMGHYGHVKLGTVKSLFAAKDDPQSKPETPKAIPWIESRFNSFDFWANIPLANFVTQDSDGDIFAWGREPLPDYLDEIPQWFSGGGYCIHLHYGGINGEMPEWLLSVLTNPEP